LTLGLCIGSPTAEPTWATGIQLLLNPKLLRGKAFLQGGTVYVCNAYDPTSGHCNPFWETTLTFILRFGEILKIRTFWERNQVDENLIHVTYVVEGYPRLLNSSFIVTYKLQYDRQCIFPGVESGLVNSRSKVVCTGIKLQLNPLNILKEQDFFIP